MRIPTATLESTIELDPEIIMVLPLVPTIELPDDVKLVTLTLPRVLRITSAALATKPAPSKGGLN